MAGENNDFRIDYSFKSDLADIGVEKYITIIKGKVIQETGVEHEEIIAGKFTLYFILLGQALENGYSLKDVFDIRSCLYELAEVIFDFEIDEYNETMLNHYRDEISLLNICFIDRIEILPQFRGRRLGRIVLKDIYHRFYTAISLFALNAFPLQLEAPNPEKAEWKRQMDYTSFEQDDKKACRKLMNYYKSLGFESIKSIPQEFMFLNTALRNPKIEGFEEL